MLTQLGEFYVIANPCGLQACIQHHDKFEYCWYNRSCKPLFEDDCCNISLASLEALDGITILKVSEKCSWRKQVIIDSKTPFVASL